MSVRLVRQWVTLNDLERRNGPYFALFLPNLVVYGAHCVIVVDKTIIMDNLRLLCLVINVCKETARRNRDKCLGIFFCISCVGKLRKIDFERSFEILKCDFAVWLFVVFVFGELLGVLKNNPKAVLMWIMISDWMCEYDLRFGYE